MWAQRDKSCKPIKVSPPTSTTPIRLAARSPERRKINEGAERKWERRTFDKAPPVSSNIPRVSRTNRRIGLEMQSRVPSVLADHLIREFAVDEHPDDETGDNEEKFSYNDANEFERDSQNHDLVCCDDSLEDEILEFDESLGSNEDSFAGGNFSLGSNSNEENISPDVDEFSEQDGFIPIKTTISTDFFKSGKFSQEKSPERDQLRSFDPYGNNFEYGRSSPENSEVTVRVENSAVMKAMAIRTVPSKAQGFDDFDGESNIPDSAFESMAAKLTSNITRKKKFPVNSKVASGPKKEAPLSPTIRKQMQTISEDDPEDDLPAAFDSSFFLRMPKEGGPQKGSPVAESDVFDGISDFGSSIPAFDKAFLPEETRYGVIDKKNNQADEDGWKMSPKFESGSLDWSQELKEEDWIPEKNESSKRQLIDNLKSFAKNTKRDDVPKDEKIKLKVPTPTTSRSNSPVSTVKSVTLSPRKPSVEKVNMLKKASSASGRPPLSPKRNDSTSLSSAESPSSTSSGSSNKFDCEDAVSVGIARVRSDKTHIDSASIIKDLTEHFEKLSSSPSQKNKPELKKGYLSPKIQKNDMDENPTSPEVRYARNRDEAADIVSSVTWIPSILRLYKRKAMSESKSNHSKFQSSPQSVMDKNVDRSVSEPTTRNYALEGFDMIDLTRNDTFGGNICDPASIIYNMSIRKDIDVVNRLKREIDVTFGIEQYPNEKPLMIQKALEMHKDAVEFFHSGDVENAANIYERFFEKYAEKQFQISDGQEEKVIVSNFLYNMGNAYLMMDDGDLAKDFFTEAIKTLIECDEAGSEIPVSFSLSFRHRFETIFNICFYF